MITFSGMQVEVDEARAVAGNLPQPLRAGYGVQPVVQIRQHPRSGPHGPQPAQDRIAHERARDALHDDLGAARAHFVHGRDRVALLRDVLHRTRFGFERSAGARAPKDEVGSELEDVAVAPARDQAAGLHQTMRDVWLPQ